MKRSTDNSNRIFIELIRPGEMLLTRPRNQSLRP